jgi:hypothetical protein
MKLTCKAIKTLSNILHHSERAHAYIQEPETIIGSWHEATNYSKSLLEKKEYPFNPSEYINKEGHTINILNKEYGSHITGIMATIRAISELITKGEI